VQQGSSERARARVAIHGGNLEALTGSATFSIPLSRCSLKSEGRRLLVRDQQDALVIWSDDEGFWRALEKAQRGVLARHVHRLRATARRRRLFKWCGVAAVAALGVSAAAAPIARWAIAGGMPRIADRIGESAIEHLDLPSGIAPEVDGALATIAEQLRPNVAPSVRSFRVLLAGYSDAHSFAFPPNTVVVTAALVCGAQDPFVVRSVVARELAHLEARDVSARVAEAVDFRGAIDLARGDTGAVRARMIDFANPGSNPGFTPEQRTAAERRASALLASAAPAPDQKGTHWSKVRAEACDLIGASQAQETNRRSAR
jgi:hypothetical protein